MHVTAGTVSRGERQAPAAALAGLMVATFCFVTTENLPVGLLPLMAADLHTSLSSVGLLVSWYGLTVAVASVPLTRAARWIPRRYLVPGLLALFVLASLLSALASTYLALAAGRVVIALCHSVFWSIVVITAAGLFPPQARAKVVTLIFGASSVATVLGVPAATWLGQNLGWRAAFMALTVLGVIALAAVTATLRDTLGDEGHPASADRPDRRRYVILLTATALSITGLSEASTFTVPFLTTVGGFSAGAISPLLLLRGAAGVAAVGFSGSLLDRRPRAAMILPTAALALSAFGLYTSGTSQLVSIGLLALFGAAMFMMITAMANRVLHVAPGRTDIATATQSAVFNAAVAAGALIGAVLLPAYGVRSTALVSALLISAAVGLLILEPRIADRHTEVPDRTSGQPPA